MRPSGAPQDCKTHYYRGAEVLPRHKTRGTITASHRAACRVAAAAHICAASCMQATAGHAVHALDGLFMQLAGATPGVGSSDA